jgi:predicted alpha/beta-hydrolase family hydrolase
MSSRTGTRTRSTGPAAVPDPELTVATPVGPAHVRLDRPAGRPRGLLVLGHGAGGGVDAVDLVAVRDAAVAAAMVVARVTQPYRVAGRRAPAPAAALDQAWTAAVGEVRRVVGARTPLVVGGRSAGARVACRTAAALGAAGVLALAYPLHPPGKPERSRAGELDPALPTLVINGDRDPFGVPEPVGSVTVVVRPGEAHDLRRDPAEVARITVGWLRERGWAA